MLGAVLQADFEDVFGMRLCRMFVGVVLGDEFGDALLNDSPIQADGKRSQMSASF